MQMVSVAGGKLDSFYIGTIFESVQLVTSDLKIEATT